MMKTKTQESLLIIDDSEENRVLLTNRLNRNGYGVTTANDGEQGLALIAANRFDLILLDLMMPGIGGLEVLERVRKTHSSSMLPIVMVTAMTDANLVVEALNLGANDYVTMPTDLHVLLARVALHLRTKRAEEALINAQRVLEQRVAERTAELRSKNQRLTELYKTAHKFVNNVSHEFRTPLTVIKEFTSILSDGLAGELNKQQLEYLSIILNRVDDLSLMVDDMLDISKLEADLLSVQRREYRVDEIVDRVRTTLERKAVSSGVTLSVAVEAPMPTVYCDVENIGRVIINLVVNACKFSTEGSEVSLWARHQPGQSQVTFGISDNGPGIAPDDIQAIFERFKQVGSDVKVNNKGFGLGLNIAQELVHVNFGDIEVESELGKGTTFTFTVPIYDPVEILGRFLRRIEQIKTRSSSVSLLTVLIDPKTDSAASKKIDEFLQQKTRCNDLVFRVSSHMWIVCTAANQTQLEEMTDRIVEGRVKSNRNRPDGLLPELDCKIKKTWKLNEREDFVNAFLVEWGAATTERALSSMQQREERGPIDDETRAA